MNFAEPEDSFPWKNKVIFLLTVTEIYFYKFNEKKTSAYTQVMTWRQKVITRTNYNKVSYDYIIRQVKLIYYFVSALMIYRPLRGP